MDARVERPPTAVLSPVEERRVAQSLSPAVAWPTLVMAVALPTLLFGLIWAGFTRAIPLWAATLLLAPLPYAHYTLVHESVHGNLIPGRPRLAWINDLVGWIGAIALGGTWPVARRTHVLHHAHTNTDDDPDIFVKGTLLQLFGKWLRGGLLQLLPTPVAGLLNRAGYARFLGDMPRSEKLQVALVSCLNLALLVAALATGRFLDWLCLWWIPIRFSFLILNVFFQWLPHHPFDRTERYLNTRVSLWTAGGWLTLQQNLHLVHHLWPSVPFYRYPELFRRLRTTLEARGSPIQGFAVGSAAPGLAGAAPPR